MENPNSPWLDPAEYRAWRTYRAMSVLLEDLLDQELQSSGGLSHLQFSVLVELSDTDGGALRMTDLAALLRVTRSRLTYTIAQVEKRGWVRREVPSDDGRGQLAILTPAGRKELERVAPAHARTVRSAVFDRLSPGQVSQLEAISTALLAGLETGEVARLPWQR